MKNKILLTLGVASFLCVFGVRSVIGCVGYKKYKQDLYNYDQGNHSIEQTLNLLNHQQLVALTWGDLQHLVNPSSDPNPPSDPNSPSDSNPPSDPNPSSDGYAPSEPENYDHQNPPSDYAPTSTDPQTQEDP